MECVTLNCHMSLRWGGGAWAHKTSLISSLFIEVSVPRQESQQSYMCVRVVDFVSFNCFEMGFWNCSDSVVFFFLFNIIVINYWFLYSAKKQLL
jgi:hypothetical protein